MRYVIKMNAEIKRFSDRNDPKKNRNIKLESNDGLSDYRNMLRNYIADARALADLKNRLRERLSAETDVDKRKDLELRIYTADTERYEILADMRGIMSYISEREGRI